MTWHVVWDGDIPHILVDVKGVLKPLRDMIDWKGVCVETLREVSSVPALVQDHQYGEVVQARR